LIFETSPVSNRFPIDNPAVRQGVEALAKQITGDARHASMEVSETPGTGQEFPQD
jgi:hypothetical protein